MSKQVDERVVSMQFDNKQFESNVSTTMSTLDKLKAKLRLDGASKGLENVGSAAKKVDVSPIGQGVEAVRAKFSALEVMGVTALANITNSAVNAGKRIASALTIDPIKSGFQEYETQMNSTQTILANTQSKGSTLDDVNKALDTLNAYADKTIYNFTEMTRNIGTFTAAGVDLQTSVDSIQGIANLAAVSGSTSQQASTAMYQLSQALAAGRVSLMDWNSVVNAGMGGEIFQKALLRTSELLKTGGEEAVKTYGSFRESLTSGKWLTTEVLTETLKQLSGAYSEADLIAQGFTEEQAKEISELAVTATDAATKVKTFTQLWDVLKESAQSGWAQTWKLIVGDFGEAKALLTPLADFLTGLLNGMSDARNWLVEGALHFSKPWDAIQEKLESVTKKVDKVKEAAKTFTDLADKVNYYQDVVNKVWRGDYNNHGDNPDRYDLLEKAGYDHRVVQDLVNKGYQYKLTVDDIEESHKKFGLTMDKTSETTKEVTKQLEKLSDEKLKDAGLTEDEIQLYRDLEKEAERTGVSIDELAKKMSEKDGRTLLIESFKNAGQGLLKVFTAIKDAWRDVFPPTSIVQLYNIIAAINEFSKKLIMSDDTAEKVQKTFRGLFSILKLITTITGGVFKIAFKVVSKVLEGFGLTILDVTAFIGDAIYKFEKFITENELIAKVVSITANAIIKLINKIRELAVAFWNLDGVQNAIAWFKDIGTNIIDGLKNGLQNGIKSIPKMLIDIGKAMLKAIKNVLGIHSPSKEMIKVGKNTIEGLVNGLKNGLSTLWEVLKSIGSKMVEIISNIPWSRLFAAGISVALVVTIKKLVDIIDAFAAPFEGLGEMFKGAGKALTGLGKAFKGFGNYMNGKALKEAAIGIALLAASVWLLSGIEPAKLWSTIGAIAALALILGVLTFGLSKLAKIEKGDFSLAKLTPFLISMSITLLLMATVIKQLGNMDTQSAIQGFIGLGVLIAMMVGIMVGLGELIKVTDPKTVSKVGSMLLKLSVSLLLMVLVCKLVAKLTPEEMIKGYGFVVSFIGFVAALVMVTKSNGDIAKLGGTLLAITAAMGLMVIVCKLAGSLSVEEMLKGAAFAAAYLLFIKGLIWATKVGKEDSFAKLGATLIAISFALILMAGVCKLIGLLSVSEMIKGGIFIAAFVILIKGLINILKIGNEQTIAKVSLTILAIAGAIAILAGITIVLGIIPLEYLAKGIIAVGLLSVMMKMLITSLKDANDVKGSLIVLTIAIAVMTAAIAGLSFIEPEKLAIATAALSAVIGMFALLVKVSKSANGSLKSLITLTIALGVITGALLLLSLLPTEGLLEKAEALSAIMISVSAAMLVIEKIGKMKTGDMTKGIVGLTVVLGLFVGFAAALNAIPMDNIAGKSEDLIALSAVMGAMTILLVALTGIGALMKAIGGISYAAAAIGGLIVLCATFALFALALNAISMDNISKNIEAIITLTGVMTVMSVLLVITAAVGAIYLATVGIAATGLAGLALMLVMFAIFADKLNEIPMDNLAKNKEAIESLIEIMTILGDLLFKLAIVGPLAVMGVSAFAALEALMVATALFATAVGALITKFPVLEKFLDTGLDIMIRLAGGIGEMVGAFINGALMAATQGLPELGTRLSSFMTNVQVFIDGVKTIDHSVLEGINTLVKTILAITAANVLESIASFITGKSSIESFALQLPLLGSGLLAFSKSLEGINPENIIAASKAAESLAKMSESIPNEGGMVAWFTGEKSVVSFAAQLPILGAGLLSFSNSVAGINPENIVSASKAAASLAEMADTIPNEGGVAAWFAGDNSIASFAMQLPILGTGLLLFSNSVAGINPENITAASEAAKALTDMSSTIPNEGGMVAWFTGDNSIASFASQLPILGAGLLAFSTSVAGINPENITAASEAAKNIAQMSNVIPNEGGMVAWFTGDNSIASFADKLPALGEGIKAFSDKVAGINPENVKSAANASKTLAEMANGIGNTNKLISFGDNLSTFGEKLKSYYETIKDMNIESLSSSTKIVKEISTFSTSIKPNTVKSAANSIDELVKVLNKCSKIKGNSVSGFKKAVSNLGKVSTESLLKAFKDANPKMKKAGSDMMAQFVKGLESKKESVNKAGATLGSEAAKGAKSKSTGKNSMESAGKDLGSGLVKGIEAKEDAAYNAGFKLGKAAVQGEKDGQDSNSPSKETIKAGKWLGEGLVIGIKNMQKAVYSSSYNLGQTATNSISGAVSKVVDIMNSDVDSEPTIRPILDLSDVQAGANSINGMFTSKTLSLNTDMIGSISASMDEIQNGKGNGDVVSAIKALRNDIANMPRNTYSINGITYDDGSNVSDAIQSLVRAARIERRV